MSKDIYSLSDFKRHTSSYIKKIKRCRRPMVLTVNGKASIIVQDADSYQKLLELADQYEAISSIQVGMAQSKCGDVMSLNKFDKHMRKKYDLLR